MRLAALPLLGTLALAAPALAAETYTFDKSHTEILFGWSHLGNSTQHAEFRDLDGNVTLDPDDPANSKIDVTIKADSIDTGVAPFDEHIKSADFFEVEAYPEIRFVSTSVEPTGGDTAKVTGDLTIKGETKPVTMEVVLNYMGEHQLAGMNPEYAGKDVAGFTAAATILRSDFGLGMFVPLVGDEVSITINTELMRDAPQTASEG